MRYQKHVIVLALGLACNAYAGGDDKYSSDHDRALHQIAEVIP